ncbi:MAG TPA: DEAD/DEAH box helicase [Verrucomicrobiae bacterium]|nr:DEAD/DEAH box helicase [Verrucomicrobiae bacterium]
MEYSTKKSRELTLHDRLSRLTFRQASKLLGEGGERLIQKGGAWDVNIGEQVVLNAEMFRLRLPASANGELGSATATVTIQRAADQRDYLEWECSLCDKTCEHIGAAFSLLLEDKLTLGLAAAPAERIPLESLSEDTLIEQALGERAERARSEKMVLESSQPGKLWADYTVTSAVSGKTYRLALRGWERGQSFCSCPDFRKNTLGTCKHILNALDKVKRRFKAAKRQQIYVQETIAVHLRYGKDLELRVALPPNLDGQARTIASVLKDRVITDCHDLLKRISKLEAAGFPVLIYPDAEEYVQQRLFQDQIETKVAAIRAKPASHPLRKQLLKTELLPYQLDGIAFAVGAGRAVLADDMGLGKTIQGIGVAELLAREVGIRRVLVICPATLKSQWRNEIQRFSERDSQLVIGSIADRARQYANDCFFTVCNYEQVLRDILAIEQLKWDLIILDEGQRIKNWEAKTSRIIKGLKSRFALVLSGTPMENRLDELFSVVEFIDDRRLGPAFHFFNRHRLVDEKGKVLGYKNLDLLRERLKPILLRRTRQSVMQQLPPRTTEMIRIPPTDEQLEIHRTHMQIVSTIVGKKFISEMDLLRLRKALLMCRMAANGTGLVDKEFPGYSSKLEKLDELLHDLAREADRKILLFSEWTTMLDLIAPLLDKHGLTFVRLDGQVPQKKRQQLVHVFQNDPGCRSFLTSNAGATGLNLQAANTVINVDLPWNPAVLEQRIARAHRMGQKQSVQVYILVTEQTIEENLLTTLSAKHELALAALDVKSQVAEVSLQGGMEELKRRLEILLGAQPEAAVDESQRATQRAIALQTARQERIAVAGGQLLSSAFTFLGELVPAQAETEESRRMSELLQRQLDQCLVKDERGQFKLTVTLPDPAAVAKLASSLAKLAVAGAP